MLKFDDFEQQAAASPRTHLLHSIVVTGNKRDFALVRRDIEKEQSPTKKNMSVACGNVVLSHTARTRCTYSTNEQALLRLALEVRNTLHGAVVLSHGVVQLNPNHHTCATKHTQSSSTERWTNISHKLPGLTLCVVHLTHKLDRLVVNQQPTDECPNTNTRNPSAPHPT